VKSLFLIVLLALVSVGAGGADNRPVPAPRVLIVSSARDGLAAEFHELLGERGVESQVAVWEEATAERARAFDLVLVTGAGRVIDRDRVVLDYDRPVLGVGQYGCAYFGLLRLKHGDQHT